MFPRMSEHGLEALLALVFFGLIALILWTVLLICHGSEPQSAGTRARCLSGVLYRWRVELSGCAQPRGPNRAEAIVKTVSSPHLVHSSVHRL
jgi:hypothetical protein